MRRTSVIMFASASAAAILAILYAYRAITLPRTSLDRFMRQLATVEVGRTKRDDFRRQMDRAGLSDLAFPCGEHGCGYSLHVENTALNKLRLAPVTIAESSVTFTDGIASETRIMLGIAARGENGQFSGDKTVVVRESTDVPSPCHTHYDLLVRHNYRAFQGDTASLRMDPCVSPEDRVKALAINSACLATIGGCKTIESMLPQVFARP
jgi:hypothetical protein